MKPLHAGKPALIVCQLLYAVILRIRQKNPIVGLLWKYCANALPKCPVFAEGRYNTPLEAAKGIENGAWAVVVGSAITRPHLITKWFSEALQQVNIL